jgi:hypothetical protein
VRRIWYAMGAVALTVVVALLTLQQIDYYGREVPAARPSEPAPIARLTPAHLANVGQDVHLSNSVLWVRRDGLAAWDRAEQDRDERGKTQSMRAYETLSIVNTWRLQVASVAGKDVQIEIMDGPLAGRRGWIHTVALLP